MTYAHAEVAKNIKSVAVNKMSLQERGEKILARLNLPKSLDKYGETHLVGNIAFQTTVKPDIDIQIYALNSLWSKNSKKIIKQFSDMGINKYEERDLKQSGKHLISFSYLDESNTNWSIDITQTEKNNNYLNDAYTFYLDTKNKMSPQKIETIKHLKNYFYRKNKLKNSMSYYIYQVVLNKDVHTIDEMSQFLIDNKYI